MKYVGLSVLYRLKSGLCFEDYLKFKEAVDHDSEEFTKMKETIEEMTVNVFKSGVKGSILLGNCFVRAESIDAIELNYVEEGESDG